FVLDPYVGEFITVSSPTKDINVTRWDCDDVCQFLKSVGLEKYTPEFIINRINGTKFLQLDGAKLKTVGVQNHADRALIKRRIKDLRTHVEKDRKLLEKKSKKLVKAGDVMSARS
ncbi:unnamed protein product, partial [Soboliphyme baturini]|uniref:SAM domain-containing protein n=1 Tax=Soboliphyme baturini TaxID=241478 RepID=A0A183ITI6_9BILA